MGMDLLVEAAEQVSISLVSFSRIDTEVLEFCEAHSALILFRAGDTSCSSAPNYGPNWPDLVRIRTFLGKLVRKRSELVTKSLIFHQIDLFNDTF